MLLERGRDREIPPTFRLILVGKLTPKHKFFQGFGNTVFVVRCCYMESHLFERRDSIFHYDPYPGEF